ncbi:MAG: hypothetical protein M3373_14405 [Gemmatimonadota bacterium]|nr:hypothetical protein [Gemmatimonadota bacterium]
MTTLIRTKAGQTIVITHDPDSPRPYSRNILLQVDERASNAKQVQLHLR